MNTSGGFGMRKIFLGVAFALLVTPIVVLSQWDVKWHSTQPKDITGCEVIESGHFDNSRIKSFIACLTEKTGDELAIIDGTNGEIRWKSEQYFKIFKESIHVTDVYGDGKDEIAFAAQNTPKSAVAFYLIAASGKSFTESPRPDPSPDPAPTKKTNSTQTAPSQTAPANLDPPSPAAGTSPASAGSTSVASTPPADPPRTLMAGAAADIPYQLSAADSVQIEIFNGTGAPVRNLLETLSSPGNFVKRWDGTNDNGARVAVGPYFYIVTVGKNTEARKKVTFR
jgi:hypothetical protein